MELSVLGRMPHVSSGKGLAPSECYKDASIISVSENNPLVNFGRLSSKEIKNASILFPSSSVNDVAGQLNFREDSAHCHSTEVKNKNIEFVDEITLDMRVETEEELNAIPIVPEGFSHVNGISSDRDLSTSPLLTVDTACTSPGTPPSVSPTNDPSSNDSYVNDPCISLHGSSGSHQQKKRYLFLFRPNISKILVKTKTGNSYRCCVCGGIYRQKFSLKRHYLRSHVDFRYISEADVANCKIPVPNYYEEQHSNNENKKGTNGRKKFKKSSNDLFLENNDSCLMPGLYRCHDCSDTFCNTEAELKEHYNKHPDSVKKKFQCHVCDASFFKKQILSRHLAGHGEKTAKTVCKKCDIEFFSKIEYQKHLASHSNGKKCKYCGKILSTSANRKRHEELHEGIKTFRCPHCEASFSQRKDLDRHLRKQHSELCHICSLCNKVFPSQEALAVHVRAKHTGSPKNQESPSKSEDAVKPIVAKPASLPAAKAKVCYVCKRAFPTVYAMLKHKRNAHPFHSRRKRHKKTVKKEPSAKVSSNLNEFQRTRVKSPKTSTEAFKTVKRNGPGRPSNRHLARRDKENSDARAKEEIAVFYNRVHQNIAENLTNYLDGGISQLSLKEYNFNDLQCSPEHFDERGRIPWSHFNFPQSYDVDAALKTRGREIKRPENMSLEDELLCDAVGLTPALSANHLSEIAVNKPSEASLSNDCPPKEKSTSEEKRELISNRITSVIICYVCREKFNSCADFDEHCTNNHPNVECSFIEIEGSKESPPVVPPELCRSDLSSVGFRFSCDVPPPPSGYSLRCTKCMKQFPKSSELHEHVTICGNMGNSFVNYVPPKPNPHRRIKRTMKKRMTLEQQHAALTANTSKASDRRESAPNSTMRSTDKFYKNGRLQTKSLTVDMNYFNTKPQKTVKSVSKRGRKSYAIVSSMYRNATLQPSTSNVVKAISKRGRKSSAVVSSIVRSSALQAGTSRECHDCGIVFVSIQALNEHIRSSCSVGEKQNKILCSDAKSKSHEENFSYVNALANKHGGKESQSNNPMNLKTQVSPHVSSYVFQGDTGTECLDFRKDIQPTFTPMDLSKNTGDNGPSVPAIVSCDQNRAHTTKSALDTAFDAVLKYVSSDEYEKTIKKQTKLTQSSVSPALKPGTVKKVGRPRKKLDTSPPLVLQKKSAPDSVRKNAISKPGRLEEAIKKLTDRSKEKQRQSNSALTAVPESESNAISSLKSLALDTHKETAVQSYTLGSNLIIDISEKSEILSVENSDAQENISKDKAVVDNSKCSSLPALDNASSSNDKLIANDKGSNDVAVSERRIPTNEANNASLSLDIAAQKNCLENESSVQGLAVPDFSMGEETDKAFASILHNINQKLKDSEEQESSQQDDNGSFISWLEDETFEIPSSRTKLNLIVPSSNLRLLPVDNENSTTASDVCLSNDSQSVRLSILPGIVPDTPQKTLMLVPESTSSEINLTNKIASIGNAEQMPSVFQECVNSTPKDAENSGSRSEMAPIEGSTESANSSESKSTSEPATPNKKVKSPVLLREFSSTSTKKNSSIDLPLARRGPGRPRRKLTDEVSSLPLSTDETSIPGTSASLIDVSNTENKSSEQTEDTTLHLSTAVNEISSRDTDLPGTNAELPLELEHDEIESSERLSAAEPDNSNNQIDNDSATSVSLRNFRTKSKQVQNSGAISKLTLADLSSKTTDFGKSLASRMNLALKEKMRFFDSSKALSRGEEPIASTSSETSDTNSQASNEDEKLLKIVKKENEAAESTKIHSCPYCMLEFAYLTNFRRHINKCQTRFESTETEPVPGTPSTHLQHLPKKDEVDYSILNLYRHQSRQTELMKEVEVKKSNQPIQKYECGICHRIYLNLFGLMQHKTHHKLAASSSDGACGQSSDIASCSQVSDIDGMLSFGSDLESNVMLQQNQGNFENEDFNSMMESQLLENSERLECDANELEFSSAKETDSQLGNDTSAVQWPNTEHGNDENADSETVGENEIDQLPNLDDNVAKDNDVSNEEQPFKRKRGRPVGWRKNADPSLEGKETKISKGLKRDKNAVIFKKKVGKLQSMDGKSLVSTKLKASTRKVILNEIAKPLARQNAKSVIAEKEDSLNSVLTDSQDGKSDDTSSQHSLSSPNEMLKSLAKRLPVKDIEIAQSVPSDAKDSPEMKSQSPAETEVNVSGKRGRGKSQFSSPTSKSESGRKRRPGRPAKCLLPTPGTSQSTKSSYSPLSGMRSVRKALAIMKSGDSSDSEIEEMPPKAPIKKKVHLKICPLCKEKFASNLELCRHIQLVHSRRVKPEVPKPDSSKVPKKLAPKSPSIDSSENEGTTSVKRSGSPLKKSPNFKVCRICNKEFLTYLLLRNHQQIVHEKNMKSDQLPSLTKKPDAVKSEPSTTHSRKPELLAVKSPSHPISTSADTSECDSDVSFKRSDSQQKRSPNLKICAICKKKFLTGLLLSNHLQAVHSRKSDLVAAATSGTLSRRSEPVVVKSGLVSPSSPKTKEENVSGRSSLSRQCRKPLPPLKRKRIKKEPLEQPAKKTKS